MSEPITKLLVLQELQRLHVAFPAAPGMKNNPEGTAAVYCEGLHGLTADALRAAVKITIENEKYFPKVADLRTLAWEWTRRHSSDVMPELKNPLWCARCGTEARWLQRWRPRVDPRTNAPILSTDGQYFALERYERLLCQCAAPCAFEPELEFADPWMLRSRISRLIGASRSGSGGRTRVQFAPPMSDEQRAEWHRQLKASEQSQPAHAGELAENMAAEVLEHA